MRLLDSRPKKHVIGPARLAAAILVLILLGPGLLGASQATFWSSSVTTNSTSWSIFRQSQNMSFEYTQMVEGNVSAVDYRGRSISPSISSFHDLRANDVRLRGQTAALAGNYSSEEKISLEGYTPESIYITTSKEAGSPVFQVDYSEQWPVIFRSAKFIHYDGRQINDAEYLGNNQDYAGSSFLYNRQLTRESNVAMILRRMNATVIGVNNTQKGQKINEKLTDAKFMPSREMLYRLNASSTGIADLKYKIASSSYDFVPGIYPAAIEGEERYAGKYYIERRLYTRSDYIRRNETEEGDDWIPCCSAGIDGESSYPSGLQKSTEEVFDCSCFQPPVT